MHTSYAVLSLLVSASLGTPLARRGDESSCDCDKAPAGPDTSIEPIDQPSCDTAEICVEQCNDNAECQSCAFGLPPSHETPICKLFGVPGAHVPPQESEIHIFDKACTDVPTERPSHDHPRGPPRPGSHKSFTPSKPSGPQPHKEEEQLHAGGHDTGKHDDHDNEPTPPKVSNKQTDNGKGKPPGKKTGHDETDCDDDDDKKPPKNYKRVAGAPQPSHIKPIKNRKDECGITSRGLAKTKPAPIKTHTGVNTLQACVDICKKNNDCQSCEFGRERPNEPQKCNLFKVPVASLPPPPKGANVVCSNAGC